MVESSSRLRQPTNKALAPVAQKRKNSAQGDLERWATEVLCKRGLEAVIVVLEEVGELEDLSLARLNGLYLSRSETLAEVGVDLCPIRGRFGTEEETTHLRNFLDRGVHESGRHVGG